MGPVYGLLNILVWVHISIGYFLNFHTNLDVGEEYVKSFGYYKKSAMRSKFWCCVLNFFISPFCIFDFCE